MSYEAISTVHIQAMPGATIILSQALSTAVARAQVTGYDTLCFLSTHPSSADEWVIHRHLGIAPCISDAEDPLHYTLMELLVSGQIRKMSFDMFSHNQNSQELNTTGGLDE